MFSKFVLVGVYRNERLALVCKLSSNVSKDSVSCVIGLCQALKHDAHFALDQWDLSTQLCLKYLACTSKI